MSIPAEQISSNWETFQGYINKYITGDRKDQLLEFYNKHQDELVLMPASHKTAYHNAFPGGYVDHGNRVVQYAVKQSRLYEEMGGTIDFTMEELVFAGLFHDLGKIGTKDQASYLPQTDKWRQDKLHEM